ncbi:SIMPL domain-containing protein [Bacillus aerolatus]|uniref:SIMPL domain-containing protein n=1 Tax=Bacillus aerolatus TaxID=2653354 RepID=UPI00177D7B6A|nr:SIMPL domain-containing protein [Bacillus aerolatus]
MYDYSPYTPLPYRNQQAYTMTVEGNGQITVKPDEAILTVGVVSSYKNDRRKPY